MLHWAVSAGLPATAEALLRVLECQAGPGGLAGALERGTELAGQDGLSLLHRALQSRSLRMTEVRLGFLASGVGGISIQGWCEGHLLLMRGPCFVGVARASAAGPSLLLVDIASPHACEYRGRLASSRAGIVVAAALAFLCQLPCCSRFSIL